MFRLCRMWPFLALLKCHTDCAAFELFLTIMFVDM